jgi:predicted kinase
MKISNVNDIQPEIYILVGLPGSGKSTWVNSKIRNSPISYDIVSSDNIIEKIAKKQNKTYSEVFVDNASYANKQIWIDFKNAINSNHSIIWDQTNMSIKKRSDILRKVPENYKKIAVVFNLDDDELIKRLDARAKSEGKTIPSHIILNMKNQYQEPTKNEGFDDIIYVT